MGLENLALQNATITKVEGEKPAWRVHLGTKVPRIIGVEPEAMLQQDLQQIATNLEPGMPVILDFAKVEYFSVGALGKIPAFDKAMAAQNVAYVITEYTPDVKLGFQIASYDKRFPLREDFDDALEFVHRPQKQWAAGGGDGGPISGVKGTTASYSR